MGYVPFYSRLPKIAKRETRTVTILSKTPAGLPPGEYAFLECFCDEPGCDCRRVFFCVVSPYSQDALAVIAYGWEDRKFYARWFGSNDRRDLDDLRGPVLNLFSPQSKLAPAILEAFKQLLLPDTDYIDRVKQHYRLFRASIDGESGTRASGQRRRPRT